MESETTTCENDHNTLPPPIGLSNINLKLEVLDDEFCIDNLNSSPESYFQDFFDQFPITASPFNPDLTIQANGHDPFDPFCHGSSSDFGFYEFIPYEQKVMQNPQGGGFLNFSSYNDPFMEIETTLEYHDPNPLRFFVPDETSCVTAGNIGSHKGKNTKRSKNDIQNNKSNENKNVLIKKSCRKGRRTPRSAKGQWTIEEDRVLINLVEKYGVRKWANIAQMLKGRIGKQCRERWHNHLRPDIKKDVWTEEEDRILIEVHAEVGNKWAEIAKSLPGRTENSIKNHWNATKRRQFSRRKCRTKWPKPSSILQNYIKSLNFENNKRSKTTNQPPPTTDPEKLGFCPDDHMGHDYDFDEIPEFDFDDDDHDPFEGSNMESYMDDIPVGPPSEIDDGELPFDMPPYLCNLK
ncbi:hypothetical protein BUALT_Bualt02G0140700 [Buddleja alternifolia]|uniref:Transcription factor MYB98 n=1 Tax=Buddleja alternifolia TaxID=168488 RepID=A0AAV6Y1D4_9LAMI|nr:hypothetical protein BUALT_Bualt02G0140700 [Buddleja alternifolia]